MFNINIGPKNIKFSNRSSLSDNEFDCWEKKLIKSDPHYNYTYDSLLLKYKKKKKKKKKKAITEAN